MDRRRLGRQCALGLDAQPDQPHERLLRALVHAHNLRTQGVLARLQAVVVQRQMAGHRAVGVVVVLLADRLAVEVEPHHAAVHVVEEVHLRLALDGLRQLEGHLDPLAGLSRAQEHDAQAVELPQELLACRLCDTGGVQRPEAHPARRQAAQSRRADAQGVAFCVPPWPRRLPEQVHLDVLAVSAEGQVINHERVPGDPLNQAAPPVAVRGVRDLADGGRGLTHHVPVAQRGIHRDSGLDHPIRAGQHLIAEALQQRRAVQAQLQDREGVVRIARGAVEPVQQDEVAGCLLRAAEAAEQERFLEGQAAVPRLPHRRGQWVDAPLGDEVLGQPRLQALVRPERLPQAEDLQVNAGAIAVLNPATVPGQVGGLVQVVHRGGVERPVRHAPGDEHLLAEQELLQRAALQRPSVAAEQHPAQDGRRPRVVPEQVVALARDPGMFLQRREVKPGALDALLPDGARVVRVEVPPQAIQRDRRVLPVPRADVGGRSGQPVDALVLAVVELPREGVRHLQALFVAEDRTLLDEVPEQDRHVRVVVIEPRQGVVLVLDALAVNLGDILEGLLVGEGEPQRLPSVELVARHIVRRHPLGDAAPAEVSGGFVPFRGLPDLKLAHVPGHLDALAQLDLGQPPDGQRALLRTRLVELADEDLGGCLDAGKVAAAHEHDVVPIPERVVQRAHNVAFRARVAQVQQRVVPVVQLADRLVGGAIAQDDQVAGDRHRPGRRGVRVNRHLRPSELLDGLRDAEGLLVIYGGGRGDDGHVRLAVLHQLRDEVQVLELVVLRDDGLRRRRRRWGRGLDAGDQADTVNDEGRCRVPVCVEVDRRALRVRWRGRDGRNAVEGLGAGRLEAGLRVLARGSEAKLKVGAGG